MLRCEECGKEVRTGEDARGWRALLTAMPDDDVSAHTEDDDEVPASRSTALSALSASSASDGPWVKHDRRREFARWGRVCGTLKGDGRRAPAVVSSRPRGVRMAELVQQVQQLESEVRELQAMLQTDRERIDRLTNRVNRFAPESHGPSAEDIQRAFGGRVFGLVGHRGEYGGWGGAPGAVQSVSLRFTVQGKDVEVGTATREREPREEWALVSLAGRALTPIDSMGRLTSLPPLPFTLTFEERAARLRVCGREHDFKSLRVRRSFD
jgi:hypothetical protein